MGIGTSQVRDVLASQCLASEPLKVRRIDVNGKLSPAFTRKTCPDDHSGARVQAAPALRTSTAGATSTACR